MDGNIDGEKNRLRSPVWVWPHLYLHQHLGAAYDGGRLVTYSKESDIHAGRSIAGRIVKWWQEVRQLKELD